MKKTTNLFYLCVVSFLYFILGLANKDLHLLSFDQLGKRSEVNFDEGKVLLAGDRVTIEFNSHYNQLGTVMVRFYNNDRDSDDELTFTLSESDSKKIIYQANYKTDQFLPNRLFSFGFPPIEDSASKRYTVTIKSLNGNSQNGIYISANDPIFVARSVLSKKQLSENPALAINLAKNKAFNLFQDKSVLRHLLISLVPLLFYLVLYLFQNAGTGFIYNLFLLSTCLVFYLKPSEVDYFLLSLGLFWLLANQINKVSNTHGFIFGLLFFCFSTILSVTNSSFSNVFFTISVFLIFYTITKKQSLKSPNLQGDLQSFWPSLNDFELAKSGQISKILTVVFWLVFTLVSLSFFYNALTPYLSYHNRLIGFPRNYLLEAVLILCQLFVSAFFIFTATKFKALKKTPILLVAVIFVSSVGHHALSKLIYNQLTVSSTKAHLSTVSPNQTSEAWVDVTLIGKNFGNYPFSGQVILGEDKKAQRIISWSNEKIVFRTNPETTKLGKLCVLTISSGSSNCLPFNYQFKQ